MFETGSGLGVTAARRAVLPAVGGQGYGCSQGRGEESLVGG